jgi:multisubunit Na+/H+ antiporter MnhC subunit
MLVGEVAVKVPPHTLEVLLATLRPVGKVSVKATPLRATLLAAGLVMVKLREVVAPNEMADGLNAFAMEGGATTVMLAEAAGPLPPSLELTALVVLFCTPAAVPVTLTLKVQELLAVSVAPDKLITLVFCVAVMVPLPHEPVSPLGVETIRPAGSVSLKPTPVNATLFPFWTVKLRLVEPFRGMVAAPNVFVSVGGPTTEILAFEVFPVPPLVEVI